MDWFAWLSQTPLEPSLVYNYGVIFACNELTLDDVVYFDHGFLLSMGVAIGKHRLEILKLAHAKPKRLRFIPRLLESFFATRFNKRKKTPSAESEASKLKAEWKEIDVARSGPLDPAIDQKTAKCGPTVGVKKQPRKYVSGPINGGLPVVTRSPRLSGPLDRRLSFGKSPGQLDGSEANSPWAMLFDDLKPN